MFSPENLPDKLKYISLQDAAQYSKVYSQEYLSLRARQGKLKAVKFGRNWVTTQAWVDDYTNDSKYISLQDAAQYSKVYSQEYLSLRARQGKFKATKFGRNWVTTKVWVGDYINDENNVKANGVVYNFNPEKAEKAEKEIKQNFEKVFVERKELLPIREEEEEVSSKDTAIFEPVLKRNPFEKFSKKLIYSFGSILVVIGLVFGFLIFKPFDIKIFTEESFKNTQVNFFNEAQNKFKETKNKVDNFLTENYKKLESQKIVFKEGGLKWKNTFENIFGDVPEIYSQKTKEIFTGIKKEASHLVSHSQRVKNIVLIFYDNPQYYIKTIWQGMLNAQKETNDYIVGFPLFVKSGFQENFYKIQDSFVSSKIFLVDAGKNISSFSKGFPNSTIEKTKNNYLGFIDKVGEGIEATKIIFSKAIFRIKDFAFYVYNKLRHSLYFTFNPWNKENELLVENDIVAPKNEGGLIVIPSQGQTQDEKTKKKIRESFSDEVEVELKDADSGVITPIFKEKKGEGYMYLMVPVKN